MKTHFSRFSALSAPHLPRDTRFLLPCSAQEDLSKPVITTETKKDADGKDVLYMYIDGVKVHEIDPTKQPFPPIVTPGEPPAFVAAPSDAIVLFDGTEKALTENWTDTKGKPSGWKVVDGALESVKTAGYIQTKQNFGSCQLHVEWASPANVQGEGQGRGNSGVFLMNTYEVQVLDSYDNPTYADGQAGALYGRRNRSSTSAASPASGRATTSSSTARSSMSTARSPAGPPSPCFTTACSSRTTPSSAAAPVGWARTRSPNTRPTPTSCPSPSRTTAIPCASATSGSAS